MSFAHNVLGFLVVTFDHVEIADSESRTMLYFDITMLTCLPCSVEFESLSKRPHAHSLHLSLPLKLRATRIATRTVLAAFIVKRREAQAL